MLGVYSLMLMRVDLALLETRTLIVTVPYGRRSVAVIGLHTHQKQLKVCK